MASQNPSTRLNSFRLPAGYFYFRLAAAWLIVLAAALPLSAQDTGAPMTSDEVLDYSLQDLQTRIHEIRIENQKQEARNDSLRKRILFLREETRRLDDSKLQTMAHALDLAEQIKIEDKRIQMLSDQARGLDGRIRQMMTQQTLTQDRQAEEERQFTYAGQTIEELGRDVAKYQQILEETRPAVRKEKINEERFRYRATISEVLERGQSQRRDLAQVKRKVSDLRNDKEKTASAKNQVEERLASMRAMNVQEKSLGDKLMEEYRRFSEQKRQTIERANAHNQALNVYQGQLQQAVEKLRGLQDKIAAEYAAVRDEMKEFKSWFSEERRWLQEKARDLGRIAQNFQEYVTQLRRRNNLKTRLNEWFEQHQMSVSQQDSQQKVFDEQQAAILKLKDQYNADKIQMGDYKKQLADLRRSRRSPGRATDPQVAAMNRMINEQTRQNQGLQRQISSGKRRDMGSDGRWMDRKQTLQDRYSAMVSRIDELNQQYASLIKEQKNLSLNEDQARQAAEAEVEALRLRSQILAGSLEAVKGRGVDYELEESQQEQRQLTEYLELLKMENAALKDKANAYRSMRETTSN